MSIYCFLVMTVYHEKKKKSIENTVELTKFHMQFLYTLYKFCDISFDMPAHALTLTVPENYGKLALTL